MTLSLKFQNLILKSCVAVPISPISQKARPHA